jgi:hypothetical protein
MTRVDICAREDHETIDRLSAVIVQLGGRPDADWHDSPIGVGLQRFRFGSDEVTVFADAWGVDIAGPDRLVNDILTALND